MPRLTAKFKDRLAENWGRYQHQVKQEYGVDLIKDGLALRHKAQTDLRYLCDILGYPDLKGRREWNGIEIDTHDEICEFFVKKPGDDDPLADNFKTFAESVTETHDRLLLVPRGGFKSSIHICDLVQWTICFPAITALILTGKFSLAVDFVGEFSRHFVLSDDGTPRPMPDGKISLFQVLFPEHCIGPTEFKREEYTSPYRLELGINLKEPTVSAAGIEQNLSGLHFDLLDLDDVVTNENSLTQTRLQAVNKQVNVNKALMNPYGFFTKIGTWYDMADTYGVDLKQEQELAANGEDSSIKVLLRAALWLKPESIVRGITDETAKEEDYILWFPERLSYKFLMAQKRKDAESYAIKYLNNPLAARQIKFSREMMVARTVDTLPQSGITFEAWDLAYSEQKGAKYTVGIAGLFTGQGIYIIDMVRGRFGEYELPGVMASFAHKWKPRRVAVEDSMGARWLNAEIRREMERFRVHIPFEFVSLGKGSKANSKEVKAKPACRLLGDGRLYFWKAMAGLEELYNELEAFPKGTFTDIVCSLSLLVNHFQAFAETQPMIPVNVNDRMEKLRRDLVYGIGQFARQTEDGMAMAAQGGVPQEADRDPIAEAGLY